MRAHHHGVAQRLNATSDGIRHEAPLLSQTKGVCVEPYLNTPATVLAAASWFCIGLVYCGRGRCRCSALVESVRIVAFAAALTVDAGPSPRNPMQTIRRARRRATDGQPGPGR